MAEPECGRNVSKAGGLRRLKSSRELVFVLFINVPTLNKTFDLI
jgi:hypothetical protein